MGWPHLTERKLRPREGNEFAQGQKAKQSLAEGPGLWSAGVSALGLCSRACPPPTLPSVILSADAEALLLESYANEQIASFLQTTCFVSWALGVWRKQ